LKLRHFSAALKAAGVSSTFHLFETGGNGYGLRPSANEVSKWPSLAEEWLKSKRRTTLLDKLAFL
jgi:hypothetical protein